MIYCPKEKKRVKTRAKDEERRRENIAKFQHGLIPGPRSGHEHKASAESAKIIFSSE